MRTDFTVPSADGVHQLAACHWARGGPKAVILIVHGIKEYLGRYELLAEGLMKRGFKVYGYEQLGHGRTAGADGLGFFAKKDGHRLLIEDVRAMAARARRNNPGLPLIVFGHSLGSVITRAFLAAYGGEVDGAVLSGTLGPDPLTRLNIAVCRIVSAVRGPAHRSSLMEDMAFGGYNKRIANPRTKSDWLTRDEAFVDKFLGDPLFDYQFTTGGFADAAKLLHGVSSPKWARKIPAGLPLLFTAGGEDPCGGYGKGVETVVQWMRKAGHGQVTHKTYPGARHELHNELGREGFYDDIAAWISSLQGVKGTP
jgi:alpha-beta hydrolase superfamily lysophospholipase